MTITRTGTDIICSAAFTSGSPTSWEAIFQASVGGGWRQVTKLGTSAYRVDGGRILFDGWIAGDNVFVEFANNAVPIWRNSGGCRFGQWNSTLQLATGGCSFLFSARNANFDNAYPALFNDSANCSFNGCKITIDLDQSIVTPTNNSRRMDFSVTPGDGWVAATIPAPNTILNLRGCDFRVESGFVVMHLYQNPSSEVVNSQITVSSKALIFFERLSIGTFAGLRMAANLVTGFSESTTPFVFDRFSFLSTATSVLRSGRQDIIDPTYVSGQTKHNVTTDTRFFTSNSRLRQQYRYSLRVNAFLGAAIEDARLAIFDNSSSQVAYVASSAAGAFTTQIITRWQWVRAGDTTTSELSFGAHSYVLGKYGRQRMSYQYDNQATTPITETKELVAVAVALSEAAAAAITYVTVTHGSTSVAVAGSGRSLSDIHDYLQWLCVQDGQMQFPVLATKQGTDITTPYSWSLAAPYTGSFRLVIPAGRTLTLTANGNYSAGAAQILGNMVVAAGQTNLSNWEFSGSIISASAPATVIVSEDQLTNVTAGANVTFQLPPKTLTLIGFPNSSRVVISRSGITQDLVNNQNPPYTFQAAATGATVYDVLIEAPGFKPYSVQVDLTQDRSIPVAMISVTSTDRINSNLLEFMSLMGADTAFKRVISEAGSINSLRDEAALLRTWKWPTTDYKTTWNNVLANAAITDPSSAEISAWIGYLSSSGYNEISFNAVTGSVS